MTTRTEYTILSTHDADGEPVRLVRVDAVVGWRVRYRHWTVELGAHEEAEGLRQARAWAAEGAQRAPRDG